MVRRHWPFAILLAAGVALRAAATVAYRPALVYLDTPRYLGGDQGGLDPLGYTYLLLRPVLLAGGGLTGVAVAQHALGLAMAAALYALAIRHGAGRWLAALAAAPVLLDAYQVQAEQTIMPDVLFEALVVAAMTVLLWPRPPVAPDEDSSPRAATAPLDRGAARGVRPALGWVACGALLLGVSATVRQVGVLFVVPLLAYVLTAGPGWPSKAWRRNRALRALSVLAVFAVPVAGYMAFSQAVLGTGFRLSNMNDAYLYGRLAYAADCATLKVPGYARPLCPAPSTAARLGVDGLSTDPSSAVFSYRPPKGISRSAATRSFDQAVLTQQPLRVVKGIAGDAIKVFALTRDTNPGDPPIARWQFQAGLPLLPGSGRIGTRREPRTAGNRTAGRRATQLPAPRRVHAGPAAARLPHRRSPRLRSEPPTPPGPGTRRTARDRPRPDRSSRRRPVRVLLALPAAPARHAAAGRRARRRRLPSACRNPPVRRRGHNESVHNDQDEPEIKALTSSVVYTDNWIRLRRDEIERRDGSRGTYAVIERRDFAVVIPAERGGFHLVEEYRYPVGRRSWSFPQGGFPHGESGTPEELARLELAQETGLRAQRMAHLGRLTAGHGMTNQYAVYFLATGLTPGEADPEPEEYGIRHEWVPREQFEKMVQERQIVDDSTLAAYALLLLAERRGDLTVPLSRRVPAVGAELRGAGQLGAALGAVLDRRGQRLAAAHAELRAARVRRRAVAARRPGRRRGSSSSRAGAGAGAGAGGGAAC